MGNQHSIAWEGIQTAQILQILVLESREVQIIKSVDATVKPWI